MPEKFDTLNIQNIPERTYSCFWYTNFSPETIKSIISRTVEQIIDKLKDDNRFKYYIKDSDYTKLVNQIYKNRDYYTFSRLSETFAEFDAEDLFLSNVAYEIIQYINDLLEDESAIHDILDIDKEIARQLKRYGYHEELIETSRSTVIMWSNACACWNITYFPKERLKKGNTIKLDANMVLVPYSKRKVNKYLCLLDESPLYKYSFEAIYERKEVPFVEGVLAWMDMVISTEIYRKMQEEYS